MSEREVLAAKLSDIGPGEMKEVAVGEEKVLLARVGDECFALGAYCTHYGAPLAEGALVGDRIICPWHHACFNARSGDMLEPPALDSLPRFETRIEGDEVFVKLPPSPLPDRRTPKMERANTAADQRVFVVLGGGGAGYMAAQTLREDGFQGRIVVATREERAPYDRPNLSKDYLKGTAEPEWMPLRAAEFYEENGIELLLGKEAASVDADRKMIEFTDGTTLEYDKALIATGGVPREMNVPGAKLKNVFVLRSFSSADDVAAAASAAKHAVVIGASFIAMEAAFSLRERGLEVTVVAPDAVPFEKTLGPEIGALFRKVHQRNGVRFRLGEHVEGFVGGETVEAVELASGDRIPADLVLVGIGVRPATGSLRGVELAPDGGAVADKFLSIGNSIYAAGDIAYVPDAFTGENFRIEHWRTALQEGRVAARNMADEAAELAVVPFFWTTQFDVTLNYVGHAKGWDEIVYIGNVAGEDFLALYVKDAKVRAAAGMNRDRDLALIEELMRLGRMPSVEAIRSGGSEEIASAASALATGK